MRRREICGLGSERKKAWQGYENITQKIEEPADQESDKKTEPKTEIVRKYYDEFWVDPFCEEVWEYNVAISKELIARGFDEIQFDYIRFPTDGRNLGDATYRWQDKGMDKESALMSFLAYARREIKAPISIDIYGANGWYRTGSRTGQDVELLARYVDVICPMFYPSHFEQTFLAQKPSEERPYRIFYYGSYRNILLARNAVLIRPWTQAFYLPVSYDKKYYDGDYVQRQIFGIRDSINQGYTYWNNSGRYEDIRPDIEMTAPYPWEIPEEFAGVSIPFFRGQ
ncbi:putative glycoside hydrolase [Brucepastera parasyntrophica]|uniref:putative glycoside hydrolase n=1 Tax=Brucepastera parasyntrophica TaxID=2880008 RepID=UPI003F7180DE